MRNHLEQLASEAFSFANIKEDDTILDIGCNDGTLLKSCAKLQLKPNCVNLMGIDPTVSQFLDFYSGESIIFLADYFSKSSYLSLTKQKSKLVTSISMFYDLPDPVAFARDVASILDAEGVWVMEQSYLPTMLECNSFDTICHEHLEYYGLRQIKFVCQQSGLRILRVSLNDCNGGSFRVSICHNDASREASEPDARFIEELLRKETHLSTRTAFDEFMGRCQERKDVLVALLRQLRREGLVVYLYGASTKGNTLLQFYGIDASLVTAAAERNPNKFGKFTPVTHIPIVSEAEMRAARPDVLLVLPWHFQREFLEREEAFLRAGGRFVFPLPRVAVAAWAGDKEDFVFSFPSLASIETEILPPLPPSEVVGVCAPAREVFGMVKVVDAEGPEVDAWTGDGVR